MDSVVIREVYDHFPNIILRAELAVLLLAGWPVVLTSADSCLHKHVHRRLSALCSTPAAQTVEAGLESVVMHLKKSADVGCELSTGGICIQK